jgi:Holliday junction resolvase RusA-like endonuclease
MPRIKIKPLSLNKAYCGRRFKTIELENYKKFLSYSLPKFEVPKEKLEVWLKFGMSSKGSDIDNCVKCFLDALAENYGFNDNKVYALHIEKIDVEKEQEFVDFEIQKYYGIM